MAGGGRGGKSGSCRDVSVQDTGFAVLDLFFGGPSAAAMQAWQVHVGNVLAW